MSNSTALTLTLVTFAIGYIGYIYTWKWAHEIATEIVTSTASKSSLPLPDDWRGHMVYTRWIYLMLSIAACLLFLGTVNLVIANLATGRGTTLVAYFAAAFGTLGGLGTLAAGTLEFVLLRRILRSSQRGTG